MLATWNDVTKLLKLGYWALDTRFYNVSANILTLFVKFMRYIMYAYFGDDDIKFETPEYIQTYCVFKENVAKSTYTL